VGRRESDVRGLACQTRAVTRHGAVRVVRRQASGRLVESAAYSNPRRPPLPESGGPGGGPGRAV